MAWIQCSYPPAILPSGSRDDESISFDLYDKDIAQTYHRIKASSSAMLSKPPVGPGSNSNHGDTKRVLKKLHTPPLDANICNHICAYSLRSTIGDSITSCLDPHESAAAPLSSRKLSAVRGQFFPFAVHHLLLRLLFITWGGGSPD